MKKYEMIHAIRSTCSGMMSSNVEEITADDLELTEERSVVYDIMTRGVQERLTFTEL